MIPAAIIIIVLIFCFICAGIVRIRPFQKGVVERLGKFSRVLDSGVHFIIPVIETVKKIDLREMVIDIPPQEVICKDNVVVVVDAVIYYQVLDPVKSIYNVKDYRYAIIKLAQTNLRSIIGEMELDETLAGRDLINTRLREELDKITDRWGVKINRVEIQRIEPPKEIQEAMAKQMKAERERRAMILLAEGKKTALIKEAEGKKEADILVAEGRAKAISLVVDALSKADEKYIAIEYIQRLPELAKGNSIVVPYETQSLIGAVKIIQKILKNNQEKKDQ